MNNLLKRADKIIDTTTNVLFIAVASFIVIVVGAALFRLAMAAVVDPVYAYLAPRMGLAFIFVVIAVLIVLGAVGELVGEQLAEVPFLIQKIRRAEGFRFVSKHFKNICSVLGMLSLAKILMVILSAKNKDLELTALVKVVWDVVTKL